MNAINDPYRIESSAITSISVWKCAAACGYSGSTIRRKPYAATFESTPENTASTGSGIARYPSGIQPCSGKAGILTRNAAANPRKIQSCAPPDRTLVFSSLSTNVMWPPPWSWASTAVAIAAASISSEPTSV